MDPQKYMDEEYNSCILPRSLGLEVVEDNKGCENNGDAA